MLRDTFAGKILTIFQNQIPVSKFLSNFYRQKCRAAAEILGAWEGYELPQNEIITIKGDNYHKRK